MADSDTNAAMQVADRVRGLLAERRIPAYLVADLLDERMSRGYWQRRVAGEVVLDVADLSMLSRLLGVSMRYLVSGKPD